MAMAPSPEPFKTICLEKGYLTAAKADEMVKLQVHLAESLDLPSDFLDLCKQKGALTEQQIAEVKKLAANANASRNKPAVKELAGFEILGKAGEGAMGVVYKARQKSLDRIVALKILPPRFAKNKMFVERFIREARASAALNHPNIVQGIDVGEAQGLYYFAMEFIDGETVHHRFKHEGPLPLEDVLEIGRQTALALSHAHAKGMIHRDIKPDNLMLAKTSASNKKAFTVKVMDLGLARMVEDDASMTESGKAIGTPHYISPEQARGVKELTPACDLYSLGCSMIHIASGKTPYQGETSAVVMSKHLVEAPPDPKKLKPDLPNDVAAVFLKLMAKDPAERYPSAEALAQDLELILRGEKPKFVSVSRSHGKSTGPVRPVTGKAGGVSVTTGKKRPVDSKDETGDHKKGIAKANPLVLAGAGLGVLLAVVGLGFALSSGKAEPKKDAARENAQSKQQTPPPPKGPSAEEIAAQVKARRQADEAAKQKKLEGLQQAALELEKNEPGNFDKLRQAWMDLRTEGIDSPFQKSADEKIDALDTKRKVEAEKALQAEIAAEQEKAKAGDYDGALAGLAGAQAKFNYPDGRKALDEAAKALVEKAQADGAKRLKDAADLLAAGKKEDALKAFDEAATFKFKPVAEEAAKKSKEIKDALDAERAAAELAATERFAQVIGKLAELAAERKLDDAQTEITKNLNDRVMAPKSDALRVVAEGFKGYATLNGLIAKRLAATGGKGLSIPGGKNVYYKLENDRLTFKPTPDFPSESSRGVEYFPIKDLVSLAGLKDDGAAETLKGVSKEELVSFGSLMALLGEPAHARALFDRAKAEGGEALAKRLDGMDEALEIMQHGAAEGTASAQFNLLRTQVSAQKWKAAQAALDLLNGEKLGGTAFVKGHAQEIAALNVQVVNAMIDTEAESVTLDDLFKGKVRGISGGVVEILYDFENPGQIEDFKSTLGRWDIKDGRLRCQHPPNDSMTWFKAAFVGDTLDVSFDGEAPRGDLNCLIGPDIRQDTTGGYSFRFGRTVNQFSEALTVGDKSLAKSKARLNNGANKVAISRRGTAFSGQINGPNEALNFTDPNPQSTKHVALQTWENAFFDNLKITGKLDPEWVKSARRAHMMSKVAEKQMAESIKSLKSIFKGKLTDLGGGKVRIEYDFSDPAQLADFDTCVGAKPQAAEGEMAFSEGIGIAFHKGHWRPPFTLSFVGKSRTALIALLANTGSEQTPNKVLKEGTHLALGLKGKTILYRHGDQVSEHDFKLPENRGPVTVDIVFNGKQWIAAANGTAVMDWTDVNADSPDTHNRWGLGKLDDQTYSKVFITGTLDPEWLATVTGKAVAKPATGEPKTGAEANPPPEKAPPEKVPPPEKNPPDKVVQPVKPPTEAEPKVVKTYYAKIQGDLLWQDAKIDIRDGTPVRITAKGQWADTPESPPVGPDGDKEKKYGGMPNWCLVAKSTNGGTFMVGSKWEGPWPGRLFLQMNDDPKRIKYSPGEMILTVEVLDKLPVGANKGEGERDRDRDRGPKDR